MGFLDRVVAGAEFRAYGGIDSGLANPAGWLTDAFLGPPTYSGRRVTQRNALGLIHVLAAANLISEAVGQIPLKVYRVDDQGDKAEARGHRTWRMLHDMPNPVTPARRFWATVTVHLLLWGNAFIEERRTDVLVDELWLIDPATMTVRWNDDTKTKTYFQERQDGRRRTWTDDEILHITGMSLDGVVGLSRIAECRQALGTAQARDEFEGSFYKRGAVLTGLIKHPQKIGTEALRNLRESFQGIYGGSAKAHQVGVLEENADFQSLTMPLADMQFVESQRLSATQIAVLFNIPPSYLGGSTGESLTYTTVEGNQIQFVQQAVKPWTTHIEEALSNDSALFPQSSFESEFVLDSLMRGDAQARASYYQAMSGMKAITVNEIRALENMPPIPGGDVPGIPEVMRVTETAPLAPGQSPPAIEPTPGQPVPPGEPAAAPRANGKPPLPAVRVR